MDDRHAQFLILVGDICQAATRANLSVDVTRVDGTRVSGIPTEITPAFGAQEVDHTGYANRIRINQDEIQLQDIIQCTINDA
ncbi:MAG: hypothetical protein ACJ780_20045 [Solirubrobacteraceae bacterium]